MSETEYILENAMSAPEQTPLRFERLSRLIGDDAVKRLSQRHVMVVGLGGVGSFAVEGLARSGVGRLTLVDFDNICETNINRQLHALEGTVGMSKAALMADRVRAINPDAQVAPVQTPYRIATADDLLGASPDMVIDCIDQVTAKLHLIATCHLRGLPIVTSLGAAAKLDPTRVMVADLAKTHTDPLGRVIRQRLRRKYGIVCSGHTGIPAVFSDEQPIFPKVDEEWVSRGAEQEENPIDDARSFSPIVLGSAVFVTAVFGMVAASVVIRKLAEPGSDPVNQPMDMDRAR